MSSESGDAMSRNTIYVDVGTVPYSVPEGRVLMHNHVLHDADTPSGTNGATAATTGVRDGKKRRLGWPREQ